METWEAAVNAMQLGSALFAVTGASEGTVECRINRKIRTLPAVGPLSSADAGNWLRAFWLAVVCREQQRMTQLCEIPLDRLRSPEGQYDEYIYHWVDVLQTYWLRPRPQGGGRRRHGDREVLAAIVFVATSGCTWQQLPAASFGPSGATAHRRFTEWTKARVWARLHRLVLDELGSRGELDWSRCAIDSVNMRALRRGT